MAWVLGLDGVGFRFGCVRFGVSLSLSLSPLCLYVWVLGLDVWDLVSGSWVLGLELWVLGLDVWDLVSLSLSAQHHVFHSLSLSWFVCFVRLLSPIYRCPCCSLKIVIPRCLLAPPTKPATKSFAKPVAWSAVVRGIPCEMAPCNRLEKSQPWSMWMWTKNLCTCCLGWAFNYR